MKFFLLIISMGFHQFASAAFDIIAMDTISSTDTIMKDGDTYLFARVDKDAEYLGGAAAWIKFLNTEINVNAPIIAGAKPGVYVVEVQFIVDTEGYVIDVKGLSKHGYGMEKEVMRVIEKSARWLPAIQNGRAVRAYRKQPITFTISDDTKEKKKWSLFKMKT